MVASMGDKLFGNLADVPLVTIGSVAISCSFSFLYFAEVTFTVGRSLSEVSFLLLTDDSFTRCDP